MLLRSLTFHLHDLIGVLDDFVLGLVAESVGPGLDQIKDLVFHVRLRLLLKAQRSQSFSGGSKHNNNYQLWHQLNQFLRNENRQSCNIYRKPQAPVLRKIRQANASTECVVSEVASKPRKHVTMTKQGSKTRQESWNLNHFENNDRHYKRGGSKYS